MAKKKISKKASKKSVPICQENENLLPQNILLIGERVEEDKNIYISQPVYKEIHKFTKNKTTNESGGMLIGNVIEEFGKTNIIVNGFVEAKYCEATPTTLKFTHETWDYCHKEIDKKFPNQKIVGWIHTHPDFGIFLSEYDKFIHENFFKEDYQIAYVVDPIQSIEGFYFWINEKIEKCKGFYKFDKTGVKILEEDSESETEEVKQPSFDLKSIFIAVLAVCVVILGFTNMSRNSEIRELEKKQQELENIAIITQQNMVNLNTRLQMLERQLAASQETVSGKDETDKKNDDKSDDTQKNESGEELGQEKDGTGNEKDGEESSDSKNTDGGEKSE